MVFSVVGASAFLPFLPMLPIQVLSNNLLYDFSQTTIPTDEVDADWLTKPRKWEIGGILRFILIVGPISSILPDIHHDVVCVQLLAQPGPVPYWLVRRVALHPDADHSRHPHQQDPVFPELGQLATHPYFGNYRCGRCWADGFASGQCARVCPACLPVLVATCDHIDVLCGPDPVSEDLVLQPVWRMMAMAMKRHSLTKKSQLGYSTDGASRYLVLIARTSWVQDWVQLE